MPQGTVRIRQQQLVGQCGEAALIEPVVDVFYRPVQADLPCGGGQFPGQRRDRISARQDWRQYPPARLVGHHWQQPGLDQ
jgi:hypothetical protein